MPSGAGGGRDRVDLRRLEGLDRPHPFLGSFRGPGDRVVGEAEALLATGELEDRVEDLAVDVHGPGREVLAVEFGEEHTDVLDGDPEEVPSAEGAHDPRPSLPPVTVRRTQEKLVVAERRGLRPTLGPQVLDPGGGSLSKSASRFSGEPCRSRSSCSAITSSIRRSSFYPAWRVDLARLVFVERCTAAHPGRRSPHPRSDSARRSPCPPAVGRARRQVPEGRSRRRCPRPCRDRQRA
jgi:hypothetical protein